ncbi:MAG: hypothetical protein ACOY3Y_00010 [Acidobacteriota bacterium]
MTRKDDPLASLLDGARVPEPPPALRAATLTAAREALERAARRDPWRSVWEDRRLRWAWAAAVAALAVANIALPGRRPAAPSPSPATAAVEPELASFVALPRIEARHLGPEAAAPVAQQSKPNSGPAKENPS